MIKILEKRKQYKKPNIKKIKNLAMLDKRGYLIEDWAMLLAETPRKVM